MQHDFHARSDHFVDTVPNNDLSKGRRDLKQAWQWNAVIFYYIGTRPFNFWSFGRYILPEDALRIHVISPEPKPLKCFNIALYN